MPVKPIVYGMEISSVVRGVLLTAKAINVDLDYREINLFAGEQLREEFLKMNPQHTIPTLDDDGFYLCDSHVIAPYLVEKYASNDSLYPADLQKRTLINQRLHFDNVTLYTACIRNCVMPIYRKIRRDISQEVIDQVYANYAIMEKFLEKDLYLAGESLTVADLMCAANISSLFELVPVDDAKKYPKLLAWFTRMQALPYYEEANGRGNAAYIKMLRGLMAENN